MAQLLLLNPARKRRKSKARRKGRKKFVFTAARRRALKKAQAAQRRGKRRSRRSTSPRKFTMAKRRTRRSRRSNLTRGSLRRPLTLIQPAAVGAAGALAVNGLINYVPIPDALKQGRMIYLTRAGMAVLLGMFGARLPMIGRYANDMARGALIVAAADLGKELALGAGFNLSGTGYVGPSRIVNGGRSNVRALPGRNGMNAYVGPQGYNMAGMGKYVR